MGYFILDSLSVKIEDLEKDSAKSQELDISLNYINKGDTSKITAEKVCNLISEILGEIN